MIHLSLVFRSGGRKGKRLSIGAEKFVIGRHDQSDLCLQSRTVSRRHCAIVQREAIIAIVDLGSRNPTLVNGIAVAKGRPQRLSDDDRIQIGRYLFAVSIGVESIVLSSSGSSSNQVVTGTDNDEFSPIDSLLAELDEIGTDFDCGKGFVKLPAAKPVVTSSAAVTSADTSINPESEDKSEQDDKDEEDEHMNSSTIELPPELVQPLKEFVATATEEEESTVAEQAGPRKLPDHLRLKGPATSQEAAVQALRNLFNNR